MKTLLFFLLATLPCYAVGLNSTETDCIKQYGLPIGQKNYGRVVYDMFTKDAFTICVNFLDGNAVWIQYVHLSEDGGALNDEQVAIILDKNSDGNAWRRDPDTTDITWTRPGAKAMKEGTDSGDVVTVWLPIKSGEAYKIIATAKAKASTSGL